MNTIFVVPMLALVLLFISVIIVLAIKTRKGAVALIGAAIVPVVALFCARMLVHRRVPFAQVLVPRPAPSVSWNVQEAARAPVWSDAMEGEFPADLYPSKAAAARALGSRMVEPITEMVADPNRPVRLMLARQPPMHLDVVREFERGLEQKSPNMRCSVEAGDRRLEPNEVAVLFRISTNPQTSNHFQGESGEIVVEASLRNGHTSDSAQYVEKAWVRNFGDFASESPQEHYVVARSVETCTSENEARQQVIEDARQQLDRLVGARPTAPGRPPVTVTATDVQEGGFIADTFVQSFQGSAGKIWRQAMLIDVSPAKLARLKTGTVHIAQVARAAWAKTVLSGLGVLALILITYFFLNMATRGYYEWSLRIAGLVLVILVIVVFLGFT
jgi:hypothetical protein